MLLGGRKEICKTEKASGLCSRSMGILWACLDLADGHRKSRLGIGGQKASLHPNVV